MSIINCLMQLRKVCNHPDLFAERPVASPFSMRALPLDHHRWILSVKMGLRLRQLTLILFGPASNHWASSENASCVIHTPSKSLSTLTWGESIDDRVKKFRHLNLQRIRGRWEYLNYLHSHTSPPSSCRLLLWPSMVWVSRLRRPLITCIDWHDILEGDGGILKKLVDEFVFVCERVVCSVSGTGSSDAAHDRADGHCLVSNPPFVFTNHNTYPASLHPSTLRSLTPQICHRITTSQSSQFPHPWLLQYDCGKLQVLDVLLKHIQKNKSRYFFVILIVASWY